MTEEIVGHSKSHDGSQRFKCIGGPFHGYMLRLYHVESDTIIEFPNGIAYSIHPPVRKGGKWVLVHKGGSNA